jgi:hypothetical protein
LEYYPHEKHRARLAVSLFLAALVHVLLSLAFPEPVRGDPRLAVAPAEILDIDPAPPAARVLPVLPDRARLAAEVQAPSHGLPRRSPLSVHAAVAREAPMMDAAPEANAPVDFTTGAAPAYSGGATSGQGALALGSPRSPVGGPPHAQAKPEKARIDASRAAALAGDHDWNCPFPSEANANGVDFATATLRISVGAGGEVLGAALLRDPGHGFGSAAQRCALTRRYSPAHGEDGQARAGVIVVQVRFLR